MSAENDEKGDDSRGSSSGPASSHTIGTPLLGADFGGLEMTEVKTNADTRFHSYVCGVINQNAQPLFARMLFRISRGNAISGFSPIPGTIPTPYLLHQSTCIVCLVSGVWCLVSGVWCLFLKQKWPC